MRTLFFLAVLVVACSPSNSFQGVIEDPVRERSINFRVWMPEIGKAKLPFLLFSHGSGGSFGNQQWLIDSLVAGGFMVAAPNHPHNTAGDNDDEGVVSVWERPADMKLLLDYLIDESQWSDVIDINRIGVAGFSSGGNTAIAMAGAIYDRRLMNQYCNSSPSTSECKLAADFSKVDYSRSALSYKDERVKAVFAMAPAVGAAMTEESLGRITIPVSIMASKDDEVVDVTHGAVRYAQYIPGATLELLPTGGHFVFLRCDFVTSIADRFVDDLDLCGKNSDIDREAVQAKVADTVVRFFKDNLGQD